MSDVLNSATGPESVGHAEMSIGLPADAMSDTTYNRSSACRLIGAASDCRSRPKRLSNPAETESARLSPMRSRSAASTRPFAARPQARVVAPTAATMDALKITKRLRRLSASIAIARIQIGAYHQGQRPGACHTTGARAPATQASVGATHGGKPRLLPSTFAPADAPSSSTDTAARKSGTSQINHNTVSTPRTGA